MAFRWERGSQEGRMIRGQENMTINELALRSDKMAERIIESASLIDDVNRNLGALLNGTEVEQERLGVEIADRHRDAVPEIVEDPRERAALIVQIGRRLQTDRPTIH